MSAVIHTLPHHSTATTITHILASGTCKLDRQNKDTQGFVGKTIWFNFELLSNP